MMQEKGKYCENIGKGVTIADKDANLLNYLWWFCLESGLRWTYPDSVVPPGIKFKITWDSWRYSNGSPYFLCHQELWLEWEGPGITSTTHPTQCCRTRMVEYHSVHLIPLLFNLSHAKSSACKWPPIAFSILVQIILIYLPCVPTDRAAHCSSRKSFPSLSPCLCSQFPPSDMPIFPHLHLSKSYSSLKTLLRRHLD